MSGKLIKAISYTLAALQIYVLSNTIGYTLMTGIWPSWWYCALIIVHISSIVFFFKPSSQLLLRATCACAWIMAGFYVYQGFYDALHVIVGFVYAVGLLLITIDNIKSVKKNA